MRTSIVLAALMMSACTEKSAALPKQKKKPASLPSESCGTKVTEFRTWLKAFAKEGGRPVQREHLSSGIHLVVSDAVLEKDVNMAVSVSLSPNVVMIEGEHIAPGVNENLANFLSIIKSENKKHHDDEPTSLALFIDAKTSWKKVVDTTDTIVAAGFTTLHIAFLDPPKKSTLSPPPASSMHDEIVALAAFMEKGPDPMERQQPLSSSDPKKGQSLLQRASRQCSEIAAVYDRVAEASPKMRSQLFYDGIADAILACRCSADIPAIKELYWYTLSPGKPSRVKFKTLHLGRKGTLIAAPKEATWAKVHHGLLNHPSETSSPNVVFVIE